MKKILIAILCLGFFAAAAEAQTGWNWNSQQYYGQTNNYAPSAQDYYDRGSQVPVTTVDPSLCFSTGWDFGGYFSAMFPDSTNQIANGYGGGFLLSYFFDSNLGLELNYAAHGQGDARHVFHTNAIYRLPVNACFCGAWAPYAFGGVGFTADGNFDMLFDVGVGIEVRFQSWGCTAFFTDYSYNFVEKDLDFSQLRAGFKLPF